MPLILPQTGEFEYEEKRSKFLGFCAPITTEEEAKRVIAEIRQNHPRANHNVFAYAVESNITRMSDDGEPSGTAGMPILNVIKTNQLFNCIIIVTRYFGGIMLGAGGLVRAYGAAAGLAVKQAHLSVVKQYMQASVTVSYDLVDKVTRSIENGGFEIKDKAYTEHACFTVLVEENAAAIFCETITQISSGKAVVNFGGIIWKAN